MESSATSTVYDSAYFHNCRAKVNADVSAYRAIGPYLDEEDSEWFGTYYYNNLVVAMHQMFPTGESRHYGPGWAVEQLSRSILMNKGKLLIEEVRLTTPDKIFLKGQAIQFSETELLHLANDYFKQMESVFGSRDDSANSEGHSVSFS